MNLPVWLGHTFKFKQKTMSNNEMLLPSTTPEGHPSIRQETNNVQHSMSLDLEEESPPASQLVSSNKDELHSIYGKGK